MKIMRTALLSASYMMLATTVLAIGCSKDDDGPGNGSGKEPTEKTYMAVWQTGYLDIHHIATDRGDATFVIAPDGTTLLIDAGDVGNGWGSSGGPVFPTTQRHRVSGSQPTSTISHRNCRIRRRSTMCGSPISTAITWERVLPRQGNPPPGTDFRVLRQLANM